MLLKELRKKANLTQKQLADILGVAESAISLWESGRRKPQYNRLPKIAEALGVTMEEIFDCFVQQTAKCD